MAKRDHARLRDVLSPIRMVLETGPSSISIPIGKSVDFSWIEEMGDESRVVYGSGYCSVFGHDRALIHGESSSGGEVWQYNGPITALSKSDGRVHLGKVRVYAPSDGPFSFIRRRLDAHQTNGREVSRNIACDVA